MIISNLLETSDLKKILERSAYFLLCYILFEYIFNIVLLGASWLIEENKITGHLYRSFTFSALLPALFWGVSRSIKTKYGSLTKTPLFIVSALFIASSAWVAPNPSTNATIFYEKICVPHQKNKAAKSHTTPHTHETSKKSMRDYISLTLGVLIAIPLVILLWVFKLFPIWVMLSSGYALIRIYFRRSTSEVLNQ